MPRIAPRIAGDEALDEAFAILRDGGLVAVPTETVYGLASRADSDEAVAAIYRAKGRPLFNPLIVHVANFAAAQRLAETDERAEALAAKLWPGPLTMVLPLRAGASIVPAVTAGLATVALRCPAHPLMRALLECCPFPLAAPSANRSGAISPTEPAHVAASLGSTVPLILDGGACATGLESTIVALRGECQWQILRPGPIERERIVAILGAGNEILEPASAIEAPGQLTSHYAPAKPLRLDAEEAAPDEFLIGFGAIGGQVTLSAAGDVGEAASRLYRCLHEADASPLARIAVAPVPEGGIGAAINDRLRRAAA
ncbi:L-threonylcarbamoyladenylate synthase [Novosphingobium sp. Gsoil 351]|uniref:L-threonylcarbamoyladenylate synthase n=1 Tax=Novosphingobium sp. Gsoil 351 TaxID=2675225 RepID=UPI0012B4EA36|nr:L-threonylcarbamoyladenylate synthase [Novosphingobium sp. Gsoil 351]QGN54905.1 threonylcarbamoyl-AMP synthase [Novosphingobium sp. Gsoil 351]